MVLHDKDVVRSRGNDHNRGTLDRETVDKLDRETVDKLDIEDRQNLEGRQRPRPVL